MAAENQNSKTLENNFEKIGQSMKGLQSSMGKQFKQVMKKFDDLRASNGRGLEVISEMKISSDSEKIKGAYKVFDKRFTRGISNRKVLISGYNQDEDCLYVETFEYVQKKLLISGSNQTEDCLCETTYSLNSIYQDINDEDDVDLDFKVEESLQTQLQIQQNVGSVVPEIGGHDFLAGIEDPISLVNQVCTESIQDKVTSVTKCEFSSPNLAENTMEGYVTCKVFNEMSNKDKSFWGVLIAVLSQYDDCLCVVNNPNEPMYNDSGGKTRTMHMKALSADDGICNGSHNHELLLGVELPQPTNIGETISAPFGLLEINGKISELVPSEGLVESLQTKYVYKSQLRNAHNVSLFDGKIGCMMDDSDLIMITMDIIKLHGTNKIVYLFEPFDVGLKLQAAGISNRNKHLAFTDGIVDLRSELGSNVGLSQQQIEVCNGEFPKQSSQATDIGVSPAQEHDAPKTILVTVKKFIEYSQSSEEKSNSLVGGVKVSNVCVDALEGSNHCKTYKIIFIACLRDEKVKCYPNAENEFNKVHEVIEKGVLFILGNSLRFTRANFEVSTLLQIELVKVSTWDVMTVFFVLEFIASATLCKGPNRGLGTLDSLILVEFIVTNHRRVFRVIYISAAFFVQKLLFEMPQWNHIAWKVVKSGYCGKASAIVFDPGGEKFHYIWFEASNVLSFCYLGCSFCYTGYAQYGKVRKDVVVEYSWWSFDELPKWEFFRIGLWCQETLTKALQLLVIILELHIDNLVCLPCFSWFKVVYYWMGLKMYDILAWRRLLHLSRYYSAQESVELFSTLARKGTDRSLKGTVVYYDGQMNDSRVNVGLACTASLAGAAVLNYAEVVSFLKEEGGDRIIGARIRDNLSGDAFNTYAKVIVNVAGPFCDAVRNMADKDAKPIICPSSGVHIVLTDYYSPEGMGLIVSQTKDERVVFMLPWLGRTVAAVNAAIKSGKLNPTNKCLFGKEKKFSQQ